MDRYADVFNVRGHKYDAAMRAYPTVRDVEFQQLFHRLDTTPLKTVYDLPSGGGYLRRFIAADADLVQFEPSADFEPEKRSAIDLEDPILPPASADLVVSLAALHHVSNKYAFFRAALQALRPNGWLCVGDVVAGSPITSFLDEFVGSHNRMGHSGEYLPFERAHYTAIAGPYAELVRCELAPCPWHFAGTDQLAAFCRNLFGLQDVADDQILKALDDRVGIESTHNGIALRWELLYLQFRT